MVPSRFGGIAAVAIVIGGLAAGLSARSVAQVLIVGNDEKQGWDENAKPIFREPGKDTLTVIDISKPDTPQIASSIPMMNSVVGPPTNLAISPSGDIALVANSVEPVVQGWGHRLEPDNKVFLIDLKAHPPVRTAQAAHGPTRHTHPSATHQCAHAHCYPVWRGGGSPRRPAPPPRSHCRTGRQRGGINIPNHLFFLQTRQTTPSHTLKKQ